MARDYAEMERQFIAGLAEDTGRDLDAWMGAIAAQGLAEKNDVIDWLRRQGVFFNTASKLERIFANGGRPLYGEEAGLDAHPGPTPEPAPTAGPAAAARPAPNPAPSRHAHPEPAHPASADLASDPDIEALLAAARGYRPLAVMVLREILRAVPDAVARAGAGHIVLARERPFAALEPRPKEIRLALDLGERAFDAGLARTIIKGAPAHLGHMLTLTDARQVSAELMALVQASAAR